MRHTSKNKKQAATAEEELIDDSVLNEYAAEFCDSEFGSDEEEVADEGDESLDEDTPNDPVDEDEAKDVDYSSGGEEMSESEGSLLDEIVGDDDTGNEQGKTPSAVEMEKKLVNATKCKKEQKTSAQKPGVIYLGRIPHGFYEDEMRAYFRQFGEVTRLRLSRNKKTGASKHYAFIEFKHEQVAKIVAETMDGYLLYSHILKCKFISQDKVHPKMFVGANKKFKNIPWQKIERLKREKPKTPAEIKKSIAKLALKEKKKNEQLKALGIKYSFSSSKKTLIGA